MFIKNLQLALRNLFRDKFYTLINVIGLTVGMAAALLLFVWVNNEYSYDNFHPNEDRLYRLNLSDVFGGERTVGSKTAYPLSAAAKEAIPEIQSISTDWQGWDVVFNVDNFLLESNHTHFVYPDFLKMFDFPFIAGDAKTALNNPNSIILTETLANQLFGELDVIGKSLNINGEIDLLVTGLVKDFPPNSHLEIEALVPIKGNLEQLLAEGSRRWGSRNFNTYTLLRGNTDPKIVEKKLTALLPKHEDQAVEDQSFIQLQLVKNIYLGSNDINTGSHAVGDIKIIRLIALIGLLILVIACINYINLTTARATQRAKSVGVQKIIGATRMQLFGQHLVEAICVVFTASILAIALANFGLPNFENIVGTTLPIKSVLSYQTIPIIIVTTLSAILLSGIQPALQITSYKPISAIKGSQINGLNGKMGLRKFLVVAQFVCSTTLIICTLVMLQQIDFVKKSKLGFEKEHIFSFWQKPEKAHLVKNDLVNKSGIEAITLSNRDLVNVNARYGSFTYEGMPEGTDPSIYNIVADSEFNKFFGLKLKAGRWFRQDGKDTKSYIINEAAVKYMQLENPIGKWIDFWGRRGTIVGVLEDFHFRSFHHQIEPIIFEQNPDWYYKTYVKTTGEQASEAIISAEKAYAVHHPHSVFKYEFLDETFDKLYKKENRLSQLFSFFALLTIFISCLGIFGLATYTAERRGKEIGIRKVLGATVLNIINLLSLDFLKLVFLSLLIAIPSAWYFMDGWLANFAFSINIGWGVFAITVLLTIMIAYFTIGFQSLKAALANPSKTLKTE